MGAAVVDYIGHEWAGPEPGGMAAGEYAMVGQQGGMGKCGGTAAASRRGQTQRASHRHESGGFQGLEKANSEHVDGGISYQAGTEPEGPAQVAEEQTNTVWSASQASSDHVVLVSMWQLP